VYRIDRNLTLRDCQKTVNFSLIHALSIISLKILKKFETNIKNQKLKIKLEKYILKYIFINIGLKILIHN